MSYICDYFPHKQLQEEKTAVKSVDFTPIQIKKKGLLYFYYYYYYYNYYYYYYYFVILYCHFLGNVKLDYKKS